MHLAVNRLFISFFLALFLHGVFLTSKLQQDTSQLARPLPMSAQKITISLSKHAASFDETSRHEPQLERISGRQLDETRQPTLFPVQFQHFPRKELTPAQRSKKPASIPRLSPAKIKIAKKQAQIVEETKQQHPTKEAAEPNKQAASQKPLKNNGAKQPQSTASTQTGGAGATVKAAPLYKVNPPPMYPRLAWRRGLQGRVLLDVYVDAEGRVTELKVNSSSGHEILDASAAEEVRTWLFQPGTVNGTPTPMWVQVPITYRLR